MSTTIIQKTINGLSKIVKSSKTVNSITKKIEKHVKHVIWRISVLDTSSNYQKIKNLSRAPINVIEMTTKMSNM